MDDAEEKPHRIKIGPNTVAWYVMRDLKRHNALEPAHIMLENKGFEVYTPMGWRIEKHANQKIRKKIAIMPDLLFAHSTRKLIDPVVELTPTLQYRYKRGGAYKEPMIVRDEDMDLFINAATTYDKPRFYTVDELTPDMLGRKVRIIGGPMDGVEVPLLKMQGSKKKRIVVSLPMLLAVSVEVSPDYIELV